jgi:hypothetical protein
MCSYNIMFLRDNCRMWTIDAKTNKKKNKIIDGKKIR